MELKIKRGRRCITILLALLISVSLFSGCAGDTIEPDVTTANTTVVPATAATTEGTGTSEPSTGATEPSETPTETTQPTTESTTPPAEATQPNTEGSKSTDPKETEPQPTEPPVTEPKPTEHKHSYSSKVVAPTCTADGYTTYTCSCGDSYTADKVSKTGHKFGDWYTTKEPTTTSTGAAERKCSACGGKETKTLDKLTESHVHDYTKVVTAPTCKENGYTTYTCICGDSYVSDWVKFRGCECEFVVTKAATCTEDGIKWMTCKICGDALWSDIIPALGHEIVNLGQVLLVRELAVCPHCDVYLSELGSMVYLHYGIDGEYIMLSNCPCDPNDALYDHIMETDGSFANHSWANSVESVTIVDSRTKCTRCGLVSVSVYDYGKDEFVPVDGVNDAPNHFSWQCGYCGTEHSTKEVEEYFPNP